MAIPQRRTMHKITFLPDAEDSFKNLDKPVQRSITQKIDWLAEKLIPGLGLERNKTCARFLLDIGK